MNLLTAIANSCVSERAVGENAPATGTYDGIDDGDWCNNAGPGNTDAPAGNAYGTWEVGGANVAGGAAATGTDPNDATAAGGADGCATPNPVGCPLCMLLFADARIGFCTQPCKRLR